MSCDIVCIIDRSGSMNRLKEDAIGGFNSFLHEQKQLPDEAYLTLILFDDEYKVVHETKPLQEVPELTDKTYIPRGSTALLDAVGRALSGAITRRNGRLQFDIDGEPVRLIRDEEYAPEEDKAIFLILTDGEENSSTEFSRTQIASMVEQAEKKYEWQFVFLGAGIDAFDEGGKLGVRAANVVQTAYTSRGLDSGFKSLSDTTTGYRTGS